MKKFAVFLVLLAGCFFLANAMINDSGYVLIAYEGMTLESSLWGMFLLILITIGVAWIGIKLVKLSLGASTLLYPWSVKARKSKAQRLSAKGLAEFSHGHWKKAEKLLSQAAESGEAPLINYLAAARAAHEIGRIDASAEYLRHADSKAPGAEIAIGITQAQLQLSGGQLEQALATLTHLHKKAPAHAYILKLLKQVYIRLSDWQALARLLPKLKKHKVVDERQYRHLEKQAFKALFEQAFRQGRSQKLVEDKVRPANKVWSGLTAHQRRSASMLYRYAHCLALLGADEKAERLLRENLAKSYSINLIQLYGKVKGKDANKQLLTAEALLSERTNDPELLLALGRLAMRNELWGKAREYFEASLRLRKCVDTYNELGRLLAHLEDHERSSRYFREGLQLATEQATLLPATVPATGQSQAEGPW
ncbi:heme biosynthesis protein HemY [Endozoicomonas sp. Mp262]|uniref:heme biosynthesis HemY N-terminal domain-containing protein n=1 Tax=Endozoicomonas sp. Mp262 TaxID=2919499 RepID=UPI0021D980A9